MTTAEVLIAARAKIATLESWTRGAFGRDETGRDVSPNSPLARCWCSYGALMTVNGTYDAYEIINQVPEVIDWGGLIPFNDSATHAEVLAAFDRAIELARAE